MHTDILAPSILQSFNLQSFIPQSRSSSSDEKKSLEVRTLFLENKYERTTRRNDNEGIFAHQREKSVDWLRFREQLLRDSCHRDFSPLGVERLRGSRSVAREIKAEDVR
jgi:hypothetical protein